MGNIWDLPGETHPVSGKRKAKEQNRKVEEKPETELMDSTNKLMKTTSDFMVAGMGIAVMSGMGHSVISALSKK